MTSGLAVYFILLALFVIAAGAYSFPASIAFLRGHHQRYAILVLNLAFGWTLLGWFAALIWALTATYPEESRRA